MTESRVSKSMWSWALYDFANSAFSVTIISGFFPLFFKKYWANDVPLTTSTFYLGAGNSIASLIIVLAAPVLGALADHGSLRKRLLASFASIGCFMCIGLFFVAQGMWPLAILFYMLGVVGFSGANVVYDAMLIAVSPDKTRHRDSALGYALGYLGGGILFLINVFMTTNPELFGLPDQTSAVRWSFVSVAVWWAVFSIPLLCIMDNSQSEELSIKPSLINLVIEAAGSLKNTIATLKKHSNVGLFLLAYWLYIDGVVTIIKMGVDYGVAIGLPSNSLIVALLAVQFIGFPSTILFGRIAQKKGPLKCLWLALWIYVIATAFSYTMDTLWEFYILAGVLGLVQGAVQAISRSLYSQLIPVNRSGEFFGYFNMMGKAASVLGPIMVGTVSVLTDNSRLGFVTIILLFVSGMFVLKKVSIRSN